MMKAGRLYRHISTLDVDVYVAAINDESPDQITAHVRYWNRHLGAFHDEEETVTISKSDLYKWVEVPYGL